MINIIQKLTWQKIGAENIFLRLIIHIFANVSTSKYDQSDIVRFWLILNWIRSLKKKNGNGSRINSFELSKDILWEYAVVEFKGVIERPD